MYQPQTLGKYQILDVLGEGGMGIVYRALDPVLERIVAVKLLHREYAPLTRSDDIWARFRNEARAVARLNHPAIVAVYDFSDTDPAGAFFSMEYVDGVTLDHYMGPQSHPRLAHTLELIIQLLGGLDYAHGQGVVHRDIKPANLLVTHEGQLKITDFGIAKISSVNQTRTGVQIGTPLYMAPEQYAGGVTDLRCDLHAVGVVFFQLLTGQPPFGGAPSELMYQICHVTAPLVSSVDHSVPAPLDPVLAKALAKDPDARFQTAKDFGAAVAAVRIALGLTTAQTVMRPAAVVGTPTNASREPGESPAPAAHSPSSEAMRMPFPDNAAQSGTVNCGPTGWSIEELAEIEQQLALILGPMARIVIRRAAALTSDRKRLYEELAGQLRSDEERKRFLSGASISTRADSRPRSMTPINSMDPGNAAHEISAVTCGRTTQILARYIGPIASVLVKKIAVIASDEADLYARLAERITDDKERGHFITEITRPY